MVGHLWPGRDSSPHDLRVTAPAPCLVTKRADEADSPTPAEPTEGSPAPTPPDVPAAATSAGTGESWVVVERSDGSTVSGTLVQQLPDAIVLRSGADVVTVPMDQVSRIASGLLGAEDSEAPTGEASAAPPAVPEPVDAWVPPPPSLRPADRVAEAQNSAEYDQYAQERLQLVDYRGYWLGPRKLGYDAHQFKEDDSERFHVVVAGEPDYRLTFPEFLDLTGDEALRKRYDRTIALATAQSRVGVVLLAIGGALVVSSTASMVVGATGSDDGTSLLVAVPLLLAGAPHIAAGGALFETAVGDKRRLAGFDLESLYDRTDAFSGVQKYNSHLRTRYSLPDTWRLDRPPR